eukprot:CAMPEP_0197028196 /NCGR_PEP_ID=MMETSP1384-20130603/7936_1 /TAXON_ID=29189 /ORGANISM="Ammonia sp." /LENGTH=501 /DNA_ID=CAMNT_0042457161 /DNA_START=264 /DNA_END=1769 /DNA_ORIENTATION=-
MSQSSVDHLNNGNLSASKSTSKPASSSSSATATTPTQHNSAENNKAAQSKHHLNDHDCDEEEEEEMKAANTNKPSHNNGRNGYSNKSAPSREEDEEDELRIEQADKLEVGMLRQHEIEEFSMDQEKIEERCHPVSWSNCDATTFSVRRGPNYVSGQKSPSKKALYTVFAMDAYKLPNKINKIWQFIDVEHYIEKFAVPYDRQSFPLPPIIIINVMIPNYPPEIMGGKDDGEGYQIVLYANLSPEIQSILIEHAKNPQKTRLPASVQLFREFIHSDLVNSQIRNRFKVIARIMNTNHTDFGFLANRLVKRYNGKPFLARTSSTFYHEEGKYFAADIDAHVFGYPARQGLSYVKGTIQTAIYDVGFVIEGISNEQLPEQILACCRISKMGVDLCKEFPTKFMIMYMEKKRKKLAKQQKARLLAQQQQQHGHGDADDGNAAQQHPDMVDHVYSKTSIDLLNGKEQPHRNGNHVTSKSATALMDTENAKKNDSASNSGWFGGYFG